MRQMIIRASAAALLASLVWAGGLAAGAPVGGCPSGASWRMILPIHQPQAADHNGDGWLCRMDLRDGSFTFHDNTVRAD
jgi:hypothetical protein